MQKLTVREAAENLSISEDAVRKRIQRGTLAHRKASDGHVYVYMDNHPGAQQETGVEEMTVTSQYNRSSWWDYAAGASALLVITSALIYVLGLFTLWTPIAMTNTDYLTAWHAASLVPKTVVAGLGVQQLVAIPLLVGTLIFIILFSLHKLGGLNWAFLAAILVFYPLVIGFCVWRIATLTSSTLSKFGFIGIMATVVLFIILYSFPLVLVSLAAHRYTDRIWNVSIVRSGLVNGVVLVGFSFFVGFYFFVVRDVAYDEGIDYLIDAAIIVGAGNIVYLGAVFGVLATVWGIGTSTEMFSPSWLSWRALLSYFIVLAAAFIAAFMLTIPSTPPLPSVEIDVKGKDTEAVDGKLLTHVDAFWYVFQQQHSRVTAIPDDEVERVWVSKAQ